MGATLGKKRCASADYTAVRREKPEKKRRPLSVGIAVATGPRPRHDKRTVSPGKMDNESPLAGEVADMKRWLLTVPLLLGGLIGVAQADYVILVANVGGTKA